MTDDTRRKILRFHGGLIIVIGLANAIGATIGLETGAGPMGFLLDQPFVHVGLVQAYLLIAVIGLTLRMGAATADPHRWNRIGALAHLSVLPAYALHWTRFASYTPTGGEVRAVVLFHLAFLGIESFAALSARTAAR